MICLFMMVVHLAKRKGKKKERRICGAICDLVIRITSLSLVRADQQKQGRRWESDGSDAIANHHAGGVIPHRDILIAGP